MVYILYMINMSNMVFNNLVMNINDVGINDEKLKVTFNLICII